MKHLRKFSESKKDKEKEQEIGFDAKSIIPDDDNVGFKSELEEIKDSDVKKIIKSFDTFNEGVVGKWAIYAGLGGGFGGANFTGEIFTGTEDHANTRAYAAAQEEYENYEGMHGLRSTSDIMEEDGVDEEEAEQIRNEEMESWLDYWVEPYDPKKHIDK